MSYAVSVRTLCEFAARRGDLDLRFHLAPSGQEGVVGHRVVMGRRGATYQKEIALELQQGLLRVRGRADGYDPEAGRLEEIKTYRGRLRDMPASQGELHWAQLRVYGHMMCQKLAMDEIELALVYFNITTGRETIRRETRSAAELQAAFAALCGDFLRWAEQEVGHRQERDATLTTLQMPFGAFRSGQRSLAKAVFRGIRDGEHQAIQAPTGIGKTMGTLFPALKAMAVESAGGTLDKVFFLTAKTSGREVALRAAKIIQDSEAPALRVLELAARERACEHPDKQCHGDSCPMAKGFYDRLPDARATALKRRLLDRATLRQVGLEHALCPYHLAMELVQWCDVVVGDYNYYFDVGATLHAQTSSQQWRVGVLVDEAHNLVERARAMYTGKLALEDLKGLAKLNGRLDSALVQVDRAWRELLADQTEPYRRHPGLPAAFIQALRVASGVIADQLDKLDHDEHDKVLRFYFDVQLFLRLAEGFGSHSLFETTIAALTQGHLQAECSIRNVMPAPYLKPRLDTAHACVLFSATLHPQRFYSDVLGLPAATRWMDVESPFTADQLEVRVVGDISTRWADRQASLAPMAHTITSQYARRPGNYLVFTSSFDYLHRLAEAVNAAQPEIPIWLQARDRDTTARTAFLDRFKVGGRGIGFAVLGGIFAEGIDLPGERLVGAFIATLGLPQWNPANEALRACVEENFAGRGYEYAYLYPGLRKVVQAAGRIIRTPQDRGVVYLMDDRYNRPAVRRLMPSWWRVQTVRTPPEFQVAES